MQINDLVGFLKTLASDLEKGNLDDEDMRSVSEFYMLHKFKSKLNSDENEELNTQKDLLQFLALGWYIYNNLRNDDKNLIPIEPQEMT